MGTWHFSDHRNAFRAAVILTELAAFVESSRVQKLGKVPYAADFFGQSPFLLQRVCFRVSANCQS